MTSIEYNWPELLKEAQQVIQNDPRPSWRKLARELGVPKTTLRDGFMRHLGIADIDHIPLGTMEKQEQQPPVFEDKRVTQKPTWRELVNVAQVTQAAEEQLDNTQRIANISIEVNRPIAIMFTGDWHLGDLAVNYKQWVTDIEYLLDTPDLYTCAMGDDIQNMRAFKTLSAVLGQALSPKLQGAMLKSIIDELTEKNKLLAKIQGNHDCLDEETEIFCDNGWVKYDQIIPGKSTALTFNNGKVSRETISAVHIYDYTGDMYHTQSRLVDIMVSPNHRILSKAQLANPKPNTKCQNCGNPVYRPPKRHKEKITCSSFCKSALKKDTTNTGVPNPSILPERTWTYIQASQLFNSGSMQREVPVSGYIDAEGAPISDDEIRIAAWILTDGHIEEKHGYIQIYQRKSKHHLITDILDRLEINYTVTERNRNITTICGKELKSKPESEMTIRLKSKGSAKIKSIIERKDRLPEWVWRMNKRQFDIFLKSFIDGDGSIHIRSPQSWMIYCNRPVISGQVQALCIMHGYRAWLSTYREKNTRINITAKQTANLSGGYKKNTNKITYSGKIWCITVPSGNFLIRRNGKALFTGNSEFDEKLFGEDITQYLLDKTKAPIFKNRGVINLTVGKQKYSLLLFHKSRFSSFLRATHGEKREYQLSFPADVVCGAHNHEPAYELISTYTLAREAGYPIGGFSYLVKVGTFQENSGYGWRYFSNGGVIFNPTIVFWPDQRKMQIFNAPQDAVTFMRALRNDGTS